MNKPLTIPRKIELVFDGCYLISALVAGILLLHTGNTLQQIWGTMAIVLAGGDAFHLLPRMAAAYTGNKARFQVSMGIGKMVTSITMTFFYLMLWHSGLMLSQQKLTFATSLVWVLAMIRILLSLLPANRWKEGADNQKMNLLRNLPFVLQGMMVLWLYGMLGSLFPQVQFIWMAIFISFACYLPVVFWVNKQPKLGMLMLPKTIAYLWIVLTGFWL